jgi:hypothetical protein
MHIVTQKQHFVAKILKSVKSCFNGIICSLKTSFGINLTKKYHQVLLRLTDRVLDTMLLLTKYLVLSLR